jgi:hypothetical protein
MAYDGRGLLSLSDTIRLGHDVAILSRKLSLCLLSGELLSAGLLLGMLLCLLQFQRAASLFLLFLLLPLGHLLFQLDLMLTLGLFLVLHANRLQRLEAGEARLKWCHTSCIINSSCLGTASRPRSGRLESFVHNEHESLFLSCECLVCSKLGHGSLATLR